MSQNPRLLQVHNLVNAFIDILSEQYQGVEGVDYLDHAMGAYAFQFDQEHKAAILSGVQLGLDQQERIAVALEQQTVMLERLCVALDTIARAAKKMSDQNL